MAREGNRHGLGCFVEYRHAAGSGRFRSEGGTNSLFGGLFTYQHHWLCCKQRIARVNVLPGNYAAGDSAEVNG